MIRTPRGGSRAFRPPRLPERRPTTTGPPPSRLASRRVRSRHIVLAVTLVFIAGLTALSVLDMVRNGVNPVNVLSILILIFFWVGIGGALRGPTGRR